MKLKNKLDLNPQIGVWALCNHYVPSYSIGTIMYNGDKEFELISLKPIIFREMENSHLWYFVYNNSKVIGYWHRLQDNIDIRIGDRITTLLDNIEIEIEEEEMII